MMEPELKNKIDFLKSRIRDVPDFPRPGILFKDITPLLSDSLARKMVISIIIKEFHSKNIQAIAGIEARGFLFGMLLADAMKLPFIPIRKVGKLPFKKKIEHYDLEYGTSSIEIHEDAVIPGCRVLIHDDLLATGGTAKAAGLLIKQIGGQVAGYSFIIDLSFLSGKLNLIDAFGVEPHSVLTY
jgi:adenine phosphoribosyltransferase